MAEQGKTELVGRRRTDLALERIVVKTPATHQCEGSKGKLDKVESTEISGQKVQTSSFERQRQDRERDPICGPTTQRPTMAGGGPR